jgi:ABC-type xylose transport system substrate-binding protein
MGLSASLASGASHRRIEAATVKAIAAGSQVRTISRMSHRIAVSVSTLAIAAR